MVRIIHFYQADDSKYPVHHNKYKDWCPKGKVYCRDTITSSIYSRNRDNNQECADEQIICDGVKNCQHNKYNGYVDDELYCDQTVQYFYIKKNGLFMKTV